MKKKVLTLQSPDARKINRLLQQELIGADVNVFGAPCTLSVKRLKKPAEPPLI